MENWRLQLIGNLEKCFRLIFYIKDYENTKKYCQIISLDIEYMKKIMKTSDILLGLYGHF